MTEPGNWRARRERRQRHHRRDTSAPSIRGIAVLIGIAMMLGFIVPPIFASRRDETFIKWTWDFFELLGEPQIEGAAFAGILLLVVTPFVGLGTALAARLWPRGSLSPALLGLGLVPLGCMIGGMSSLGQGMGTSSVLYFGAQMLLLAGCAVGVRRPDRPIGFLIAATTGGLMLVIALLPIMPGDKSLVAAIFDSLKAPKFGALLFVMLLLPLIAALLGVSTAGGAEDGRRKRALVALWVNLGSFLLWLVVPMIQAFEGPPGTVVSVFFLWTSVLLLRMYPALALVVLGVTGVIFRLLPAETDLEEIFA